MTTAARIVFAVLVAATFAAFFAAQRLKHSPSVVQRFMVTGVFSPNHDGRLDAAHISFRLKKADDVTVDVVDHRGDRVRRLVDNGHLGAYTQIPTLRWEGRSDSGRLAPDGTYRVRITLRREGRSIVVPRAFRLDTRPPRPFVYAIGPEQARGPELLPRAGGGPATVHFRAPGRRIEALLFKTAPGRPRLVLTDGRLPDGATSWQWRGRSPAGRPVSPGTYLVVIRSRDKAGNIGTSVPLGRAGLPLSNYGVHYPGRGGITVRYLGVQPPAEPVRAGAVATFGIDARQAHYTWSLRRVGSSPSPIRRGRGTRPLFHVHAPGGESGVYLLSIRTRRHSVRVPFAVQSAQSHAGSSASPRGVLVVLPLITWQGRNPVDDDGDGLANLLDSGQRARVDRLLAGDGLPAGFATHEAPLLAFLDRSRRRYDVTTDAALAAGHGPKLAGHHGVLLAGDSRWLPVRVGLALRRFARGGGTVVSIGTDSLRRFVKLTPRGRLLNPTAAASEDLFGARLGRLITQPQDLTNLTDEIKLFNGTDGLFGGYDEFEPTQDEGRQGTLVAAAITPVTQAKPEGEVVIAAVRFGKGLVIRFGLPAFARRLSSDTDTATLMGNAWTLLSR